MIIVPVDDKKDLFKVEDVLSMELIEEIKMEDFWEYSWEQQDMQQTWKRRKLKNNKLLNKIDEEFNALLGIIEDSINIKFNQKHCYSSFWLDYHGFTCGIHEDGAERGYTPYMAMQLYLTEADIDLGTTWFHDQTGQTIRFHFPYKINTGYLMLNHMGQWHGMMSVVPEDHARLSSYTYFGQFSHK